MPNIQSRLGFCTWSVQPTSIDDLIDKAKQIGLARMQLGMDPIRAEGAPGGKWADAGKKLKDAGITVGGGMFMSVGEDYSTIQSIHRTGGIVPDDTWPSTWENFQKMAPALASLGATYVMFHAGFIPDKGHPVFDTVAQRLQKVADLCADHGITIGLETGQEAAATLKAFLETAARPNVGINFDPANMILYGSGDPIAALKLLIPHVQQLHIKDAKPSDQPGQSWGEEVVVGTGDVDWPSFFKVLNDANFTGDLAIEREAGNSRVADIRTAKEFVLQTTK